MSSLESSKNLASIGAILLFLSFIPVLGIVGIILVYLGMKGLSDYYHEPGIYQNALRGLIFGIVAIIALSLMLPLLLLSGVFGSLAFGVGGLILGILGIISILAVMFIFYIIAATYLRKAFSLLAQKTGEHSFETAGLLLWIGAFLTIVGIGVVLIFVAWIFATIAFFSIKASAQQTYTYVTQQQTSPSSQAPRFCPNCGAPLNPDAVYCPNCGKQLK